MANALSLASQGEILSPMTRNMLAKLAQRGQIQAAIDVGMGRKPADVVYGEQGLQVPAVAGGLVSIDPTDYLSGNALAKLAVAAKFGVAGLGALGATAIGSRASEGAALNSLAQALKGQRGVISTSGVLKKGELYPEGVETIKGFTDKLPISDKYDSMGHVYEDMNVIIRPTVTGEYLGQYLSPHRSKLKNIYAIGDNPEEIAQFILDKQNRSAKAIQTAEKAAKSKTVGGMLEKEFGDVFDYAKSARSESQYITHTPTGTKIRISGHKLPGAYESADIDIPIHLSEQEKADLIKQKLNEIIKQQELDNDLYK